MFLGNDLKNKKLSHVAFLKLSQKLQKKHLCWGLLVDKNSGLGSATLLQKHAGIGGVFCEFCKVFQKSHFGEVCKRLLLKTKIFASLFL